MEIYSANVFFFPDR